MREVQIVVACDSCSASITEATEGANSVTFTLRGNQRWEVDVCDACLNGPLFQHARPSKDRAKDRFPCDACDKTFGTQRGLSRHQTVNHPEN